MWKLPAPGNPGTDSATGVPSYAGDRNLKRNDLKVHGRHGRHGMAWMAWILEKIRWKKQQSTSNKLSRMCSSGAWPCASHAHTSRFPEIGRDRIMHCKMHNLLLWKKAVLQVAERTLFFWNTATWPPWDGGWQGLHWLFDWKLQIRTRTHGIYCKERHCGPSKLADSGVVTRFCIIVTTPRPLRSCKNPRCLGLHRETDQCEPPGGLC